jgi:tetratricopeptide (TPR) repeat protein
MPRLAELDEVWLRELARFLPELRTTRPGLGSPRPVSAADERRHIFDALAHAIRVIDTPLLLVLDDLQWCDADTLEFVHFLIRTEPSSRLLVAGTARAEEVGPDHPLARLRASLLANASETEIALQPLAEEDVLTLAADLAGSELGRSAAERLYRHTEGNPLFVVEAVRAGHAATDVAWLSPTVRAVITGRLGRLSDEAQRVTEIAATVGRAFTVDVLRHASNADDQLVDVLDELWARRIICEVASGFDFTHDLLREVAYEGISPARRRHLHAAVADALLTVHAADLGPVSASLAMHYEQAGLVRQAVEAFARAAEHAYVVFAIDDSIAFLRRARALLDRLPSAHERDELEMGLCTALGPPYVARVGYGGQEVQATYGRAVQLARRLGRAPSAPVLRGLAIAAIGDCELARATELGHELLAQSGDDPLALVEGHYVLGVSAFWRGDLEAARDNLEMSIAEYSPERALEHLAHFAQDPRAVCSIRLAYTQWHLGDPALARSTARTARELAEALAHPTTLGYVLNYSALLVGELGDAAWLRELVAAGAEVWVPGRLGFFEAQLPFLQGWLDVMAGDVAGLDRLREGVIAAHASGRTLHLTHALATLAGATLELGDPAEGRAAVADGLAWTEAHDQRYLEPELLRLDGELLAAQGEVEAAGAALTRAAALARARRARSLELRITCSLARHRGGEGELARLAELRGTFGPDDESGDLRDADALLAARG